MHTFATGREPQAQLGSNEAVPTVSRLKQVIESSPKHGLKQSDIVQQWLRIRTLPWLDAGAIESLCNAVIVCVDVEWYEHNPEFITELGASTLDPLLVKDWTSAWSVLRTMKTQHVRIKPNAHLINSENCPGYPESFQFGRTSFVSTQEAMIMLRQMFTHFDQHGCLRPVIFLGHAVDNDVKMVKERFGFDLESLGSVIATIDTQILAIETDRSPLPRRKKLSDLLSYFGIRELYLHNAGNDIVCTAVAAVLMARPHSNLSDGAFYNSFKQDLYRAHEIKYGTMIFCIKCDSEKHVTENCAAISHCEHCGSHPARSQNAGFHKSDKCIERVKELAKQSSFQTDNHIISFPYAVPCQYCIESRDPLRHAMEFPYGHTKEHCIFGPF